MREEILKVNEPAYHERAESLLASLLDAIEVADTLGVVEVDFLDGVLTIELENGGEYVINKHEPTMQIWLSSPESGASHFSYVEDEGEWQTRDGESFNEKISVELARLVDIDVEF